MTEYDWLNFVLPFLFGVIGFLIALVLRKVLTASTRRVQFETANTRLMAAIHDLVRLKNEVLICEMEIQEQIDAAPIDKAKWIAEMQKLADTVPPLVLQQVRRFGLAEPPHDESALPAHSMTPAPGNMVVQATNESEQFAQVIQHPSPWTGRASGQ